MEKRFQECSWFYKFIRYRWYLLIPIKWLWYSIACKFKVGIDEMVDGKYVHTDKYDVIKGKNLWGLLKGSAQSNMKWYYSMEEVNGKIKKYKED
jgi:hypothetical protein